MPQKFSFIGSNLESMQIRFSNLLHFATKKIHMISIVICDRIEEIQIFWSIVILNLIDVMNSFLHGKESSDFLFNNKNVLKNETRFVLSEMIGSLSHNISLSCFVSCFPILPIPSLFALVDWRRTGTRSFSIAFHRTVSFLLIFQSARIFQSFFPAVITFIRNLISQIDPSAFIRAEKLSSLKEFYFAYKANHVLNSMVFTSLPQVYATEF
jgi:hypothetical protein